MTQALLTTKLFIPPLRSRMVSRPRLLGILSEGLLPTKRLVLITAPAGYGKTTLLVEWVNRLQGKEKQAGQPPAPAGTKPAVCWLSLDEADNDLLRFLAYLLESVKAILPEDQLQISQTILGSLHGVSSTSSAPDPQGFLVSLLNNLSRRPQPVVLILDDYHAIQEPAVHQAVQFLLRSLPQNLQLVIATRSDPPLGLAQLRARDQICEIRMADLIFTPQEAADFLNRCMELGLPAEDVAALEERTEGWAAGLQLAAIAIQSPLLARAAERSAFIRDFHTSQRHILEFLAEEVFGQQPAAIQTFLLCTSVLDRLCAPLCDAVLQRKESGHAGKDGWVTFTLPPALSGQELLEMVEHSSLFLIPLDAQGQWFRYHPLFAELLRGKLKHDHPGFAEILLTRAARWSEQQGLIPDAFAQALASGNFAFAADLFERHILAFFYQSEITQVQRWLSALPEDLLRSRPLLCAVYAAAVALLPPYPIRSLPAAENWMRSAEQAMTADTRNSRLAQVFSLNIRSYWARFSEAPSEQVIDLIQQAFALLPADKDPTANQDYQRVRSGLQTNLALTYLDMGDEPAGRQALVLARALCHASGDLFNESASIFNLVKLDYMHGRLSASADLCQEALDHFASRQKQLGRPAPFSGEIGVLLAEILVEQNQLVKAEVLLQENIALAQWTMSHNILLRGYLVQARLAEAKGQPSAAFEYLAEAEKLSSEGAGLAGAQRVRLWLALREKDPRALEQAWDWAKGASLTELQHGRPQVGWTIALALAHLLAAGAAPSNSAGSIHLNDLLEWLERQEQTMQTRGWAHWEIQLRLVECLAHHKLGNQPASAFALRRALYIGEPGGYVRLFVEEGEPLRALLLSLENDARRRTPYLQQLLAAFPPPARQADVSPAQNLNLPEPLTAREIEVLRLIGQGLSNQEIAIRLVVTLNTVKKHNYSIFQKLGVPNRAQAILAARKMGLA